MTKSSKFKIFAGIFASKKALIKLAISCSGTKISFQETNRPAETSIINVAIVKFFKVRFFIYLFSIIKNKIGMQNTLAIEEKSERHIKIIKV